MKIRVELVNNDTGNKLSGEFYAEKDKSGKICVYQQMARDVFVQLSDSCLANVSVELYRV